MLFDKRKKIHSRLTRKFKLIEDLLYLSKNLTTAKEDTVQLNDQFKEFMMVHLEYASLLSPEVVIEAFDGNPLEYQHFINLFSEVVEKWISEPKGRSSYHTLHL